MGKTENLVQYECDRCGYKELISVTDAPPVSSWQEVTRFDSNGKEKKVLLCGYFCMPEYNKLVDKEDKAFANFMKGGN